MQVSAVPIDALISDHWIWLAAWLFALGTVIGSFLNVVVYRLPAGKSLVYPGSHCPICQHPIRWYDNVPVLGWLILGGRCRDCRAPIATRYPIVEAITGILFALLGTAELIGCGANLPSGVLADGVSALPAGYTLYEAGGIYLYHLVLLCTLLAAALIEHDRQRVPWRLAIFALVVGVLAPLVWPHLHPAAAKTLVLGGIARWVDPAAGAMAGLLVGFAARYATRLRERTDALMIPLLVGLFLGPQAVVALTLVLRRALRAGLRIAWSGWWVATTLVWILCWHWLADQLPWLG
jgi:prepilin signal peptidase PulO-like enzyme (type II secretory pathway)